MENSALHLINCTEMMWGSFTLFYFTAFPHGTSPLLIKLKAYLFNAPPATFPHTYGLLGPRQTVVRASLTNEKEAGPSGLHGSQMLIPALILPSAPACSPSSHLLHLCSHLTPTPHLNLLSHWFMANGSKPHLSIAWLSASVNTGASLT